MATFTENYNFIKPGEEDYYDVQDFNENMDAIDAQLMATEQELTGVSEKIGAPADTEAETVFGRLAQLAAGMGKGISIAKSMQHIIYKVPAGTTSTRQNIVTVNPEKCFVLFEAYGNNNVVITYELEADSLILTHNSYYNDPSAKFGFWIIELY